jgi:hypothetical protein
MMASISNAKIFRRSTARLLSEQEKKHLERRLALEEKVRKQGLAGQKLGKHKVPQGEVEVQLGEDLSESLRGLKVILLVFLHFLRIDVFPFSPKAICSRIVFSVCNSGR